MAAGLQDSARWKGKPVPDPLIPHLQARDINRDIRGIYKFNVFICRGGGSIAVSVEIVCTVGVYKNLVYDNAAQ